MSEPSVNVAVIDLGGVQHVVVPGLKFEVNRLNSYELNKEVKLVPVISSSDGDSVKFGEGEVIVKLLEHKKAEKIFVMKFKAKSRYRRRTGHRQFISLVEVISVNGQKKQEVRKETKNDIENDIKERGISKTKQDEKVRENDINLDKVKKTKESDEKKSLAESTSKTNKSKLKSSKEVSTKSTEKTSVKKSKETNKNKLKTGKTVDSKKKKEEKK